MAEYIYIKHCAGYEQTSKLEMFYVSIATDEKIGRMQLSPPPRLSPSKLPHHPPTPPPFAGSNQDVASPQVTAVGKTRWHLDWRFPHLHLPRWFVSRSKLVSLLKRGQKIHIKPPQARAHTLKRTHRWRLDRSSGPHQMEISPPHLHHQRYEQ